jgi:hypothetical protein
LCALRAHHAELGQVGLEGDARPVVGGLARADRRLALVAHVASEHLAEAAAALAVAGLHHELRAEDVGQLGAEAVAAADRLRAREREAW